MAVKNIKYKPLGARIASLPSVKVGSGEASYFSNLSNRINQMTTAALRQVSEESQIAATQEARDYKAFTRDDQGNITFNEAPQQGTNDYEKAYYKAAQTNAKYQIDTLFQDRLNTSYQKNRYSPNDFARESNDLRDGLLEAIREKNPDLYNYYAYDFDSKIMTVAKNVYANYAKQTEDVASTNFRQLVDSGHLANLFDSMGNDPNAEVDVAKFLNNAVESYISHGPSSEFTSGGIFFGADNKRTNLFSAEKMSKDLGYFRNRVQYLYMINKFQREFDYGNPLALTRNLNDIRTGEYKTKDFTQPMTTADGSTILGNRETQIKDILNQEQRNNLADEIYKQVIYESDRLNSLTNKQDEKNLAFLKQESRVIMTDILDYFDSSYQSRAREDLIFKQIRNIEKAYPTIEGTKITEQLRQLLLERNSSPVDDQVIFEEYMKQARDGELDYGEMIFSDRLTQKSKAKIVSMNIAVIQGDKDYRDLDIYKKGLKYITKSEDGAMSIFFGKTDNTKQLQGTYSDLHLALSGMGYNFSAQEVNSNHIGLIIDKLGETKNIAYDKQSFNKLAGSGKEKSQELQRYQNIQNNIKLARNKLATAGSDEERNPILEQIAELEEQLKSFDMNAINDEIKSLETTKVGFTPGSVYVKEGNSVFRLDGNTIQDLLMTSDVIPENERQRYMQLFGGQ